MSEQMTIEERKVICRKCEDKDDCDFVCSDAEYRVSKRRLNQRLNSKKYSGQSEYVRGNKIWLELPTDQSLVISAQARELIDCLGFDEAKFVQKLKELLTECFYDFKPEDKEWIWKAERISVSRVTDYWDEPDDEGNRGTHLTIEIKEVCGTKRDNDVQFISQEAQSLKTGDEKE
jgi:hypothetical protein